MAQQSAKVVEPRILLLNGFPKFPVVARMTNLMAKDFWDASSYNFQCQICIL